ncbi:MFS transporter [Streptomyces pactum]|uniref:MFS transporter n=1 Tax=Streptomyces pactum TaxID=68249 RepID=UPI0036F6FAE0
MSSPASAPSYAAVLRIRHARRTFGAALLGRLSYGTVFLSLVLTVRDTTGSYAAAGTASALFGLSGVLFAPARAGLVDRYGPRRVLPALATGYALTLTVPALLPSGVRVPEAAVMIWAVAAGAGVPPLGPVMRTVWRRLAPDEALLRRAYSLDTVAEELLFVTGPLLTGLLLQVAAPVAGLPVSAGLVLAGTLAFVSSPALRDGPDTTARRSPRPVGPPRPAQGPRAGRARRRPWADGRAGRRAVTAAAGAGMCSGAVEILLVALADRQGQPAVAAWSMAALSAGSAVGGLVHGAVRWPARAGARPARWVVAQGVVVAPMGLSPHPWLLVVWSGLAGLFVAPALTSAYLAADEAAEPHGRIRAGTWVNTAFNAGTAGAAAAAGLLVGSLPLSLCFGCAGLAAVVAGVATRPRRAAASVPGTALPGPGHSRRRKAGPPREPADAARDAADAGPGPG